MSQQTINIGAAPNDGTGDSLRVGGEKIDANFTELYAMVAALGAQQAFVRDVFYKADPNAVAFAKTGAGTVSLKAGAVVEVGGALQTFAEATPVTMPALVAGTDYAIYVCDDGSVMADVSFSAPAGYEGASRRIGGFHYAPGGNATGYNTGGDTTPAINEHSLWDLKFRPACPDPRGMARSLGGRIWGDIYLLGVNHHADGTSRNNATIADGSSPPKVPLIYGGNGSTTYSNFTHWVAAEVLASRGKRLPTYAEFCDLAFGVQEAKSRGDDPVTTGLATTNAGVTNADEKFTSACGIIQATGTLLQWGADYGQKVDGADYAAAITYGWKNWTGGRGQVYAQGSNGLSASLLGGSWVYGGSSGSRCSAWGSAPSVSADYIGARGCCDHLQLV
jgi:hypothetical protein